MRTKRSRNHIAEIAKKYGITIAQVEEIVEIPFRFTADVMKEGNTKTLEFDQVRLMKWGVFKVKEGRRKHFERLNKKNEELNRTAKQRAATKRRGSKDKGVRNDLETGQNEG